ncbi:MAG: polysaccharide deacetylase family protein [Candidatus Acidiferrales bacterium]
MTVKSLGKDWIQKAVVGSRVLDLAGRFRAPSAVILMYHSVRDDPKQHADLIGPGITHAASTFRHQMEILAREFAPVALDDILLFLRGEVNLPRRAVAVTFDDGFADNEEIAAPILDYFGIRGSFYATVDLIGTPKPPWYCRLRYSFLTTRKSEWANSLDGRVWSLQDRKSRDSALLAAFDLCAPLVADRQERAIRSIELALDAEFLASGRCFMMNWDQLRHLQKKGHIVGSHTLTHPNVAHVADDTDLRTELAESKKRIELELGSEVVHFSYPHPALDPQWSDKTVEMTASAGYKTAVTTTHGLVSAGANPLCLGRLGAVRLEQAFRWNLSRIFIGF